MGLAAAATDAVTPPSTPVRQAWVLTEPPLNPPEHREYAAEVMCGGAGTESAGSGATA